MYQELEMYKEYKKEKQAEKIQHNHEVIASAHAIAYFLVLTLMFTFVN